MELIRNQVRFIREFIKDRQNIGAVLPSSIFLGESLAAALSDLTTDADQPIRVIEVGPGTGAVTRQILKYLRRQDQLLMVEANSSFCGILNHSILNQDWNGIRISLVNGYVQDLNTEQKCDCLISSLPFLNFPPAVVKSILNKYQSLLKPGGILSYYEYAGFRTLRKTASIFNEKAKAKQFQYDTLVRASLASSRIKNKLVLQNIPPAIVRHVFFEGTRTN